MTVKVELLDDGTNPIAPVSFFDPSLKEVRQRVFYQWARTCKQNIQNLELAECKMKLTEIISVNFMCLRVRRAISLLGSPIWHRGQVPSVEGMGCRFRRPS